MFENHSQAFLEFLRGQELNEVARACIEEAAATGRPPALAVIESGALSRVQLLAAVADHLGWTYAPDLPAALEPELVRRLDPGLARLYQTIPLRETGQVIDLLVADPFDPRVVPDLGLALGCEVRLVVADPDGVAELVRRHYGSGATPGGPDQQGESGSGDDELGRLAVQAPIIRWVDRVLAQAVREGASDLHFEPFEEAFVVRFRVDGFLRALPSPPHHLALPVISRLKVMADLNIAERRIPQDGRLRIDVDGRGVDLRVSTLPTQFGESVVLRVLDPSVTRLGLEELGLPPSVRAGLEAVIHRPNGILLVTGPTGSGKTTTLYSALRVLNRPDVKILTVEDPVEYEIDGVMQVGVLPGIGRTFAATLRAFLRQDPDIMLVGEIRDDETARVAVQAALTGHLVLATLHTNDAAGVAARLADMGVEPFLIASAVEAVLAQRLVRRVCRSCREFRSPTDTERARLSFRGEWEVPGQVACGRGCEHCGQSGYRGRFGLYEWLPMTSRLRDLVAAGAPAQALKEAARSTGFVTLREAGLHALSAGETTVEEVLRYT